MRKLYIWLLLLLGGSACAYFLYTLHWEEAFAVLAQGNPRYLATYLLASIAIRVLHTVRWQVVLHAKRIHIPFLRALSYRTAGMAVSFVTPGPRVGGEAVTAGLLGREKIRGKRIKFSRALSTVILDRSVELQTFAALFFICMVALAMLGGLPANLQYVLLALAVFLLAAILLLAINVSTGKPYLSSLAKKFAVSRKALREVRHFEETIVAFYRAEKAEFVLSHLVAALAWFISFIEFKYLLLLLGFDVPLYGIFIIYSFVGLAYLLPVPLALGSLEAAQATAFSLLGLRTGAGLLLAFITRVRDLAFTIIGFIILLYYGVAPRKISQAIR